MRKGLEIILAGLISVSCVQADKLPFWMNQWITWNEQNTKKEEIKIGYEGKKVIVTKKEKKTYEEEIKLPKGVELKINKNGIILTDRLDSNDVMPNCYFIYQTPEAEIKLPKGVDQTEKGRFRYARNGVSMPEYTRKNISQIIEVFKQEIYKPEFMKTRTKLIIEGKELLVKGPNREGEYELICTKRMTDKSLLYNPKTGLQPYKGWPGGEYKIKKVKTGIWLMETKKQKWFIELKFGNTNVENSYNEVEMPKP